MMLGIPAAAVAFFVAMLAGAFLGLVAQSLGIALSDHGVNVLAWSLGALAAGCVIVAAALDRL